MANQTIYPYGTGGSLPDGYPIVNDLVTGGADKALSAEMGKYMKALVESYESRLDDLEESGAVLMNMSGKTLVISRITDPIVLAGDLTRTELNAVAGGSSIPSVFFISGRNLESNIGIALSDSTNFTLSASSLTPVDGKVVTTMVSVTYTPASGAAADTTHNCNVVITYDGTTQKTMSLSGTVAASASVSLTPSSLTLKTVENGQTSGTIHVGALALSGDVTLELTGSGLSFADDESVTTKTIARADAEDGIDVTIYYTAGASDVTGTLTASSTGVTSVTATINGVVAVPLAVGSYWLVNNPQGGKLKYVVTSATNMRVSVEGSGSVVSTNADPLIIPVSVNDSEATVYDSGGNVVSSSGLDYAVTSVADSGFQSAKGANIHTIVLPEGLTTINQRAFQMTGDYVAAGYIQKVVVPSTLKTIGQFALSNTGITSFDAKDTTSLSIGNYAFYGCTKLRKIKLNGGSFGGGNTFGGCPQFNGTGTNPVVVSYAQTAPSYASSFKQSGASTVTATLYCPDVAAYNAAGWNVFTEVLDISNYEE